MGAFGLDPQTVVDRALQPTAQLSARLIGGLETLECELSEVEQRFMAASGKAEALLAQVPPEPEPAPEPAVPRPWG